MSSHEDSTGEFCCAGSVPGSVLENKLTGGSAYFFGLKFLIFLFFWVWKNLSYFFGSEDFLLIFFG